MEVLRLRQDLCYLYHLTSIRGTLAMRNKGSNVTQASLSLQPEAFLECKRDKLSDPLANSSRVLLNSLKNPNPMSKGKLTEAADATLRLAMSEFAAGTPVLGSES